MSLNGEPAPDFSDPLGMLAACHQRMLSLCGLLERLPAWIDRHGVDAEAVAGIDRVVRYFATAAPLHHADEEHDLFPLLADDPGLVELVMQLRHDHRDLDSRWSALAAGLEVARYRRTAGDGLDTTIADFCDAYRAHIGRENTELLPRAAAQLTDDALAQLGDRMAARRR